MVKSTKSNSPPFPDKIKVGSLRWTVLFRENPGDFTDAWGCTDFNNAQLEFVPNWPSIGRGLEIVIHEVNHAIFNTFASKKGQRLSEEEFVTIQAAGFATVLVDNPMLAKWLTWAINEARKETQ
jgi:hypothetical protein